MKPWWQVVTPHKDIREGRFDEAVFAADLGDVVNNRGPVDYVDPEVFYQKTYLTAGLKNLIKGTLLRTSGKPGGGSVIQLQTPFGGGKTHTLVALYHLLKNGEKLRDSKIVKELLKESGLKKIPKVNVAVFVGTQKEVVASVKTPWGEIAHQLGEYFTIEESDKKRIAPGKEALRKILEKKQPILILIDELSQYAVKAAGERVGEGTLKGQLLVFLQELTETVASLKKCVLVITLPSSMREQYDEAAEEVLLQLQKVSGRIEKVLTPVEGVEIYEIIRKRLFDNLGKERDHGIAAQKFFELYQSIGEDIPAFARETRYRETIKKSYPFHPEIIDILFERWGTIQSFQRTRGVLRLLALIVADLYKKQDPSLLILPSKIDLGESPIRNEFVKHIGNACEGVIASDIAGPNSKAKRIDNEMGTEYQRFRVAVSLANSIFFYSFSGAEENRGVGLSRIRLAFLQNSIPPAIVGDAIKRLEEELWYLYSENSLYYFGNQPNLNRIIIDCEEAIKDEDAEKEIKQAIEKISGKEFVVFLWPQTNADIPDDKRLKLVLLSPRFSFGANETRKFVNEILAKKGASGEFRTYKNTIVFAIISENEYKSIRKLVVRLLSLRSINDDKRIMRTLSDENRLLLSEKLKEAESSVPFKLFSAYRHIAKGGEEAVQFYNLGIATVGEVLDISKRVKNYLKEQDLLLTQVSPTYVIEQTFAEDEESKTFGEVKESFYKFTSLPTVVDEDVIKDSIYKGTANGTLGVKIADEVIFKEDIFGKELTDDALIVTKELAQRESVPVEEVAPVAPSIPPAAGTIKRIKIKAQLPYDKLNQLVSGVFAPLKREGADIRLNVEIDAESESGIKKDTLQLKIKETLKQIKAEILEWKEE